MAQLEGKVALITGGSSGIGLGGAESMAAEGAAVVVCGISQREVDRVVSKLRSGGARASGYQADVTDEAAVEALVVATVETYGGLDVIVTAAGIQRYGTAADTTAQAWDEVMSVNVKGSFLAIKHALPHIRARGGGSVIMISSVQAFSCQTGVAAYTASKGALNALARSIALDEAKYAIRVNTVCPGSVDTPMLRQTARDFGDGTDASTEALIAAWGTTHPLGRVAQPSDIGDVIAFLASDKSRFVTGTAIPVDGGLLAQLPGVALPQD